MTWSEFLKRLASGLANTRNSQLDLRVVFEFLKQKFVNGLVSTCNFFAKGMGGFASHLQALASDLRRGKQFAAIIFVQMIRPVKM